MLAARPDTQVISCAWDPSL